jgi:hypothetical protein
MNKDTISKCKGLKKNDLRRKKRQPQNARGSKQRPLMKKEATPKHKGLKQKYTRRKKR